MTSGYDGLERARVGPQAHLHIGDLGEQWKHILKNTDRRRQSRRAAFPVGFSKFRPSLEDIIEFLIQEQLVNPQQDWRKAIQNSREDYHSEQLRSTVMDHTTETAGILRELGWEVTEHSK